MAEREGGDYSREAYDAAEREAAEAKSEVSPEKSFDEVGAAVQKGQAAEAKKDQVVEMSWDEALKVNEEYNRIWAQKEAAEKAVADFRTEHNVLQGPAEAREEEKEEPTLEDWAGIYAEMEEVDQSKILEAFRSLQAEMSEDERKELAFPIYVKEGTTTAAAWDEVKSNNPTYQYIDPERIKIEGETGKAIVAFARFSQEADEDSLGENAKKAVDWEKTGEKFMSPKMAMIAREAYRRSAGQQMDEKNWTMCPGSRSEDGYVPRLGFGSGHRGVGLDGVVPGVRFPSLGVRRVVSKEL